jgi:hypothetical protein
MLLSVLYGLLALLVFYAYLVALRKTDETMLGVTVVVAVLLAIAFDSAPNVRTLGASLLVSGVFVVMTTRRIML